MRIKNLLRILWVSSSHVPTISKLRRFIFYGASVYGSLDQVSSNMLEGIANNSVRYIFNKREYEKFWIRMFKGTLTSEI